MLGHNGSTSDVLRGFRDRLVRLEQDRRAIVADIKSVTAEAKAVGFAPSALKRIVTETLETAVERAAREEVEALTDVYRASLGMLRGTPLGETARARFTPTPPSTSQQGETSGDVPKRQPEEAATPTPPPDLPTARSLGATASVEGMTILQNPFVAGDPRRAAWDEGWCSAAGSDGMDIPAAWRRKPKATGKGKGE